MTQVLATLWRLLAGGRDNLSRDLPVATVVAPTPEEAAAGLRRFQTYVAVWKATPALLVEKPDLAVIVSVGEIAQDAWGFRLVLAVEQTLLAPAGFDPTETIDASYVWNQPYASFDDRLISAPYSFYLHFGEQGVARIRQLWPSLPIETEEQRAMVPGLLRSCFDSDDVRVQQILKDWFHR